MTEAEWLVCTDPTPMLKFLRGKASDRRLRLFACACGWRVRFPEPDLQSYFRNAVAVSEAFADGNATAHDLSAALDVSGPGEFAMPLLIPSATATSGYDAAKEAVDEAVESASQGVTYVSGDWHSTREREQAVLAGLLRCIIGNPFCPFPLELACRTQNVISIAQAIYDDRRFENMLILADALEDAGCSSQDILSHCRQPGVHTRGCWCLDLLLGKE